MDGVKGAYRNSPRALDLLWKTNLRLIRQDLQASSGGIAARI
jgi:hypothetical protein